MYPIFLRKSSLFNFKHSYDAIFEERFFFTFVNVQTKQKCGFLIEFLSTQTSKIQVILGVTSKQSKV